MSGYIWYNQTCWLLYDWTEMKKIIILLPVYNDWESLNKVLEEINSVISKNCVAIDINSQFEIDFGIKDFQLIKNFINEL